MRLQVKVTVMRPVWFRVEGVRQVLKTNNRNPSEGVKKFDYDCNVSDKSLNRSGNG